MNKDPIIKCPDKDINNEVNDEVINTGTSNNRLAIVDVPLAIVEPV